MKARSKQSSSAGHALLHSPIHKSLPLPSTPPPVPSFYLDGPIGRAAEPEPTADLSPLLSLLSLLTLTIFTSPLSFYSHPHSHSLSHPPSTTHPSPSHTLSPLVFIHSQPPFPVRVNSNEEPMLVPRGPFPALAHTRDRRRGAVAGGHSCVVSRLPPASSPSLSYILSPSFTHSLSPSFTHYLPISFIHSLAIFPSSSLIFSLTHCFPLLSYCLTVVLPSSLSPSLPYQLHPSLSISLLLPLPPSYA